MPAAIPRVAFDCMFLFRVLPIDTARPVRRCGCFFNGAISLFSSEAILREVRNVLSRPEVRRQLPGINDRIVNAFLAKLDARAILIAKVPDQEGKYVISGFVSSADEISVKVYDAAGSMVYEKKYSVDGTFGEVYNLKQLDGTFSISVSDADGSIKEYKAGL